MSSSTWPARWGSVMLTERQDPQRKGRPKRNFTGHTRRWKFSFSMTGGEHHAMHNTRGCSHWIAAAIKTNPLCICQYKMPCRVKNLQRVKTANLPCLMSNSLIGRPSYIYAWIVFQRVCTNTDNTASQPFVSYRADRYLPDEWCDIRPIVHSTLSGPKQPCFISLCS